MMERSLPDIDNIEHVVAHLCNRVTYNDIVAWLGNFSNEDKETALQLLGYLNLFTSDRIYETLKFYIDKIVQDFQGDIYIIAVTKKEKVHPHAHRTEYVLGGVYGGQSGQLISYYARKVVEQFFDRVKVIEERDIRKLNEEYENQECTIVLIDDIYGTGDTFVRYYFTKIKSRLRPKWKVAGLAIAYMQIAEDVMGKLGIKVYGEKIMPIFDAIAQAEWGKKSIAKQYFALSVRYGEQLYKPGEGNITPLGYKNSRALVGFEYGVPNNTLPIIWSSKNANPKGRPWQPLFARNIADRLDMHSKRKDDAKRCYLMAWKQGIKLKDLKFNDLPLHSAIRLFSVLSILEHHKDSVLITNALCISASDYQQIIDVAHQNDLIDSTNNLKEKALVILSQIKERSMGEIKINAVNDQTYLP